MPDEQSTVKLFLSFNTEIQPFVAKVCHHLERQGKVACYFYPEENRAGNFEEDLRNAITDSTYFILFLSSKTLSSYWQQKELTFWLETSNHNTTNLPVINVSRATLQLPAGIPVNQNRIPIHDLDKETGYCSSEILRSLGIESAFFDGLPTVIQAVYEKDIIRLFKENKGSLPAEYIRKGYPASWPKVKTLDRSINKIKNPLDEKRFGTYRNDSAAISVDARHHSPDNNNCIDSCEMNLSFPEAGPREKIFILPNPFNVAILISGGIAPGINAIISSIVDRHHTYQEQYQNSLYQSENQIQIPNKQHAVNLMGCMEGFNALCEPGGRILELNKQDISHEANNGGSIIPTARADQLLTDDPEKKSKLLKRISYTLEQRQISILYVIGGEGSMRAAHAIWTVFNEKFPEKRLSVIGIPKTMDNDILWVWQSIGFLSAVEKARQIIIQLYTETISNPNRVCITQLFGSSSGYVVSHAALGSNVCDLALIPELTFSMEEICRYMIEKLQKRRNEGHRSPYGLIVMAETAIPADAMKYIKDTYVGLTEKEIEALELFQANKRRVVGQTPDHLRNAGLKIVSKVLEKRIQQELGKNDDYWLKFRVFTNEPRHIVRSIEPSTNDVAYGSRLGTMAVDMAMAGYTDCMISQWLTEYVAVPLELVTLGRKQVPLDGIFWKTVIAKIGQIDSDLLSGIGQRT
jgi:6-phosphofructokinase 1